MAATVGCDREVSLRVSSSFGTSWNSRSSLQFLAASLLDAEEDTVTLMKVLCGHTCA